MIVVCLGDSTTAGTPLFKSPVEAPPDGAGDERSQYAHWLRQALPGWQLLNRGVNGERSDEIAARFERDVLGQGAGAVIIIAGVNDVYQGRAPEHVTTQLDAMYRRAHAHGLSVIAGSIVPYNTATADQNARMHAINDWIARRAAEHEAALREAGGPPAPAAAVPETTAARAAAAPETTAARAAAAAARELAARQALARPVLHFVDTRAAVAAADNPDRLAGSPDDLHPDVAGYRAMAEALLPALRQLARRTL